jgi:hypothetical protein
MPLLTPSRIAVVVLTLSLVSFLWTFGLPRPLAQPSLPVVDHYPAEGKIHTDPIVPAPAISSSHAITTSLGAAPTSTLSTPQSPKTPHAPTGLAGHDDDGGRWEDKTKDTNKDNVAATAPAAAAATLHTPKPAPTPTPKPSPAAPSSLPKFCKEVHFAPHVMVIVRTSKAEINTKLAGHLKGLLSCVPNFAIFSDHAGEIDGIPVHDALDSISDETRARHNQFREYDAIKSDLKYTPDPKKTKELDKWKFMPMVYKAYRMKPDARFYVFIEADTSLSWTNLLQWTSRLDYRIAYYSGAPSYLNKISFAQRGPGIMLSQGAMRNYAKSYDELYASDWEPRINKECCGDLVLATALNQAHVEFYHSWPLLQAEQPHTLDYTKRHWCAPAVSWHHMDAQALDQAWDTQKNWTHGHGWDKPYLYQHAFEQTVQPIIASQKKDWDNLSSDTKIVAPKDRQQELAASKLVVDKTPPRHRLSRDDKKGKDKGKDKPKDTDWGAIGATIKDGADNAEACQKLCSDVDDCLQWRHSTTGDGECHLSKVMRRGAAAEVGEGKPSWTSGWMVERIEKTVKEWECKDEVKWGFYQ